MLYYKKNNEKIKEIISRNIDEIKSEVLADNIVFDKDIAESKEWNLNGETVLLGVER